LSSSGLAELSDDGQLPQSQNSRRMRLLQKYALVQHGVNAKEVASKLNPNVIYSPYTDFLFGSNSCPQIITCHDRVPLFYPNSKRSYLYSRFFVPSHLIRAERVIAISQSVADTLVDLGLTSRQIDVVPNGVAAVEHPIASPFGEDILMLARHDLNKNIGFVLIALARFIRFAPSWQGSLVVIGKVGSQTRFLKNLEKELGLLGRVTWTSHLDDEELDRQMRRSYCLVSASLMEGFDYPLLEAQAIGLPTLASRIPVHSEFHSNTSLLFCLSDQGVELSQKLQELFHDPSLWKDLSSRGLLNSRNLSLSRQASSIYAVLKTYISR